jgi:hypothetical protein
MNKRSEKYLSGIPMKPYDLLKEVLIMLAVIAIIVIVLASVLGSPDYPTVRAEDVANLQPVAYLETSATILAGNSSIQYYGPPYTEDRENAQHLFRQAPANWFGVKIPLDPAQDFILKPLARVSVLNGNVTGALETYESASTDQQQAWLSAYLAALDNATVVDGQVQIPSGDYGPVSTLMDSMLALGKAGLLEGALDSNVRQPFEYDFTQSLLFFQDDVDGRVAEQLDMSSDQWGVMHETGNYPGAWWLFPYAFLYHVPPMNNSSNADIQAIFIILMVFLFLLFLPVVPIFNRLPRWLRVYKLIWRDWYSRKKSGGGEA